MRAACPAASERAAVLAIRNRSLVGSDFGSQRRHAVRAVQHSSPGCTAFADAVLAMREERTLYCVRASFYAWKGRQFAPGLRAAHKGPARAVFELQASSAEPPQFRDATPAKLHCHSSAQHTEQIPVATKAPRVCCNRRPSPPGTESHPPRQRRRGQSIASRSPREHR